MIKKGISAIVATVLIILITVAAVTILWGAIFPMVNDLSKVHSSTNAISIVTEGGYTLYDEVQGIACVQVMKQTSEEINGLKVLFSVEGNSHFSIVDKADLPEMNQKRTYCFNLTNFGKPDTVTVVTLPEEKAVAVSSIIKVEPLSTVALNSIIGGGNLRTLENPNQVPQITYYFDSDQDGYSNGSVSRNFEEGTQWSNYTLVLGDCNDFNSSIKPSASEAVNNGIDENCDGWADLSSCFTITAPARYRLVGPLSTARECLVVLASGVVIDGNRYGIAGSSGNGIKVEGYNNVTIQNIAQIIGFSTGVYLYNSNNSRLINNTFGSTRSSPGPSTTTYAIMVEDSSNTSVVENRIDWNATGGSIETRGVYFRVNSGKSSNGNSVLRNNLSVYSQSTGAYAISATSYGVFNNFSAEDNLVSARGNAVQGVYLYSGGSSMGSFSLLRNRIVATGSNPNSKGMLIGLSAGDARAGKIESNYINITGYSDPFGIHLDSTASQIEVSLMSNSGCGSKLYCDRNIVASGTGNSFSSDYNCGAVSYSVC